VRSQIGFVFLPQKAQNAQNPLYSLFIKELMPILPKLKLALFSIFSRPNALFCLLSKTVGVNLLLPQGSRSPKRKQNPCHYEARRAVAIFYELLT
jgi:hypothetical protein